MNCEPWYFHRLTISLVLVRLGEMSPVTVVLRGRWRTELKGGNIVWM